MKKVLACLTAVFILIGVLSSCAEATHTDDGKLSIICTIFPEYDWVKNILGSHFEDTDVSMLLDNGVDLHSYQPSVDDIVNISTCDVFIYVGGESDKWVEDALKEATNSDMIVIDLLDVLGDKVKEEEVVEGMESDSTDNTCPEYDEHVWLSLKNAAILCDYIAEKLESVDHDNGADYLVNAKTYIDQLNALDTQYADTVSTAKFKTLLFGDRFPLRYLIDDYGLSYYAAFAGCSAETEASFETIAFLAGKIDELKLTSVITIEGSDQRIAETIIENTESKDQKLLSLDSMQSISSNDVKNGVTYLSIMEKNLDVLKQALN